MSREPESADASSSSPQLQQTPHWSIVVIARNEEHCIGLCLQSVLKCFAGRSYELILVDSASTDRTVEIAARFPAKVVQLSDTKALRPSVGRHVGFRQTRGRWILFLDGDSTLNPDWVGEAEAALISDSQLGGVAGEMEHSVRTTPAGRPVKFHQFYPESDYRAADFLGGSAAYTREALRDAGGFNPFLCSCEEAELGARMRKAGYRLLRLGSTMTEHFPKYPNECAAELRRRIRRGFFVGMGQFVRYCYSLRLPVARPYFTIQRHLQFFALLVLGVIAALFSVMTGWWQLIALWAAGMSGLFALFAWKRRSLQRPAYYFLEWTVASPLVIRGLLQRARKPEEFVVGPCRQIDSTGAAPSIDVH